VLSSRAALLAVCAFAVLAVPFGAAASSPAAGLAKQLKASMQAYYKKTGLKITTASCKIAASGSSARCNVRFAAPAARAVGVFVVSVTQTSRGEAQTKTLSVSCKDSKTGAKLKNCV
jgi:hypothetical protein